MGTIGQTKAAEMAYRKVLALKAQFYRRDLNPADDYKGSLMERGAYRRQENLKSAMSKESDELLKIAEYSAKIEEGFKR
jgi:hypothetical protein